MKSNIKIAVIVVVAFLGGAAVFAAILSLLLARGAVVSVTTEPVAPAVNEPASDTEISVYVTDQEIATDTLHVEWSAQPERVDASTLGLPTGMDLFGWETEAFVVYRVGEVVSAPFIGADFYLIERACGGPCGISHYRVIDAGDEGGGLMLLANYSNDVFQEDESLFAVVDGYTVPDLEMPETFQLANGSTLLDFREEPFSPSVMYNDFTTQEGHSYNIDWIHPTYGTIFEDQASGYFIVRVPDHTVKLYQLELPVSLRSNQSFGMLVETLPIDFTTEGGARIAGDYSPIAPRVCPPRAFDVHADVADRLRYIGSTSGMNLYVPSSQNDPLMEEVWNEAWLSQTEMTYEEFVETNPVLFFKDALGRWMRMRSLDYYPALETECQYIDSVL